MPSIEDIAYPKADILVPVPAAGDGVCRVCHGAPGAGFAVCFSCHKAMKQVSRPCPNILALSLYRTNSQLWSILRYYKDSPSAEVRARMSLQVSAFLGILLDRHAKCIRIECGRWDGIATVPSTSGRSGPHPVTEAVRRIGSMKDQVDELLAVGPVMIGHTAGHDEGFVVTKPVAGRNILVVDDTYTSGARAQSAASALQLAGAKVPAIVVVGRVINPEFSTENAILWDRQRKIAFDFTRCAFDPAPAEFKYVDPF